MSGRREMSRRRDPLDVEPICPRHRETVVVASMPCPECSGPDDGGPVGLDELDELRPLDCLVLGAA